MDDSLYYEFHFEGQKNEISLTRFSKDLFEIEMKNYHRGETLLVRLNRSEFVDFVKKAHYFLKWR